MFFVFAFIILMIYMIEEFQKDDAERIALAKENDRLRARNDKKMDILNKIDDKVLEYRREISEVIQNEWRTTRDRKKIDFLEKKSADLFEIQRLVPLYDY